MDGDTEGDTDTDDVTVAVLVALFEARAWQRGSRCRIRNTESILAIAGSLSLRFPVNRCRFL